MATSQQYLAWCAKQVGKQESPRGSNRQPYAALAGHANGLAWCASFLVAGARVTGLRLPPGADTASTAVNEAAFKRAGRLFTTPQVGDIGFVYFPTMKPHPRVAHTFVVWGIDGNYVRTFEGNSNDDGAREGYEVCKRRRLDHRLVGQVGVRSFGRPYYDTVFTSQSLARVKKLQMTLGFTGPAVDGDWGDATEYRAHMVRAVFRGTTPKGKDRDLFQQLVRRQVTEDRLLRRIQADIGVPAADIKAQQKASWGPLTEAAFQKVRDGARGAS